MSTGEKQRVFAFDVLKLLAILLILNSHFDALYPGKLALLATGGSWGNALFFLISGYFCTVQGDFWPYVKKKLLRLYPPVLLFSLLALVLGFHDVPLETPLDYLAEFVWPTYYWFVGALLLYQLLLYGLERSRLLSVHFGAFTLLFAALLLGFYIVLVPDKTQWAMDVMGFDSPEKWLKVIFFFYIFALGFRLRQDAGFCRRLSLPLDAALILLGALGYVLYKQLLLRGLLPVELQILAPLPLYALSLGALSLTLYFAQRNAGEKPWQRWVTALSSLSLEIYVVQFPIISACEALPFPLNAALALLLSFAAAAALKALSGALVNKFVPKEASR